jgi:hypothetical protein
MIYSPI